MAELRSTVKQQDKKIAELERRLSEFEGDVREIANDESQMTIFYKALNEQYSNEHFLFGCFGVPLELYEWL